MKLEITNVELNIPYYRYMDNLEQLTFNFRLFSAGSWTGIISRNSGEFNWEASFVIKRN